MNTNDGTIISNEVYNDLGDELKKDFVEISNNDMTFKQQIEKQVSKHDNRSKLGKQFTNIRHQKRFGRSR